MRENEGMLDWFFLTMRMKMMRKKKKGKGAYHVIACGKLTLQVPKKIEWELMTEQTEIWLNEENWVYTLHRGLI